MSLLLTWFRPVFSPMIKNTCPNAGTPSPAAGLAPAEEAVATAGRNIIPPTATARPRIFSVRTACMACLPQERDPTTVGPQQHDGQDSPPGQPPPGMGMLVRGCLTDYPQRPTPGPAASAQADHHEPAVISPARPAAVPLPPAEHDQPGGHRKWRERHWKPPRHRPHNESSLRLLSSGCQGFL